MRHTLSNSILPGHQRGALIVVTLIILLVVSMLGMATMDTSGLEMRMANNSRDQQQAFEAAEYTLSQVQEDIIGAFNNSNLSNTDCGTTCFEDTCSNGYCFQGADPLDWANCSLDTPEDPIYADPDIWDDSGFHRTLAVPGINVTTKFIVEFRCYTALDQSQDISVTNFTRLYRITAFATGPAGRGRAMLRATIKES